MTAIIPNEQHCPRCGAVMTRDGFTPNGRQRYECGECGKKTSTPPPLTAGQLGPYLQRIREGRGYTYQAVSAHLGHDAQWLSGIEAGEGGLGIDDLFALADVYGMKASEIIADYERHVRSSARRVATKRKQER